MYNKVIVPRAGEYSLTLSDRDADMVEFRFGDSLSRGFREGAENGLFIREAYF